jgi:hypothetical protein
VIKYVNILVFAYVSIFSSIVLANAPVDAEDNILC